jgi:hypothetical protein
MIENQISGCQVELKISGMSAMKNGREARRSVIGAVIFGVAIQSLAVVGSSKDSVDLFGQRIL